ncbi:MAG: C45 family peptidase, partial [Bacteroidia bacterium]|nr:C45 family peptidase [Bacteroidia bacterium]
MERIRKVIVSGTPYQQGVLHGKAFPDLILKNLELIRTDMTKGNPDMSLYDEIFSENSKFFREKYPEQWEEMKGISEGAELPFEDIVLLNIPIYFMKPFYARECTMLYARGKATADGCGYMIKNRDLDMPVESITVEHHYDDGMSIVACGLAGIITYPSLGVNNYGLTVSSTGTATCLPPGESLSGDVTAKREDFSDSNIFLNLHHVLRDCTSVRSALEYLKTYPRMNGLNVLMADEKDAVAVEMTRTDYRVEWIGESDIIFRTNHYLL